MLHGVYAPYFKRYQKAGIDISRQPMEIAPAAHTSIGGIHINTRCETACPACWSAAKRRAASTAPAGSAATPAWR